MSTVSKPLRIRRLREQLSAVRQYLYHLRVPLKEGYRHGPKSVEIALLDLEEQLDDIDRELSKIDKRTPAVGGAMELLEVWRDE